MHTAHFLSHEQICGRPHFLRKGGKAADISAPNFTHNSVREILLSHTRVSEPNSDDSFTFTMAPAVFQAKKSCFWVWQSH